jgi:trans-aconitate 2-methyltransferase
VSGWNPDLYLKFEKERTQPVKDLIFRIEKENPARIIDIGCGPGNSTIQLKKRWPDAFILGIDSSTEMIDRAKRDYPQLEWRVYDANNDLSPLGKFDLVFSNAAIQWMPNHKELLKRFFGILNDNGVLAVQIPNVTYMPVHLAVQETAKGRWSDYFAGIDDGLEYHELTFYYDALCSLARCVDLWETHYHHVLPGHEAIIEWYSSTGMRPYLEKLTGEEKQRFLQSVLAKIREGYKVQEDGKVLFPFRRLFFVAYK